ncbi:MAG: FtsH protease activity modulator HflK [Gammaproteobacteria bacterium]|nr:FtsH protease activity modulator HflK [Gammaproteobacteria bacterium]
MQSHDGCHTEPALSGKTEMGWDNNSDNNSGNKRPGGNDPWGGGGNNNQQPPDLDEVVKKLQESLSQIFGGGKGKRGGKGPRSIDPSDKTPNGGNGVKIGLGTLFGLLAAIWLLSGIYIVDPAERGVELYFGKYFDTTMPGPHWVPPYPVAQVEKVNVEEIRNIEIGYRSRGGTQSVGSVPRESLMLTKDENIIDIKFAVQYRVKDAKNYLFSVLNPDETLRQATESAVRDVIGKSNMDHVLTAGRADIASRSRDLIQEIADRYSTGLEVTTVNMQDAQPPDQVQGSFADVVKAREDKQRLINESEAYSNDLLPRARGASARIIAEAEAYREKVIVKADGEASRFTQVLVEYERAPEVTRKRIYIDTMEKVLSRSSKVMVDVDGGNSLLYLPLDKMVNRSSANRPAIEHKALSGGGSSAQSKSSSSRSDPRSRGR